MSQINGVGQSLPAAPMPNGPNGAGVAAQAGDVGSAAGATGAPSTGSTASASAASGTTVNMTTISQEVTSLMTSVGLNPGDFQVLRLMIAMMLLNALLGEDGKPQDQSQLGMQLGLGGGSQTLNFASITRSVFEQTTMSQQGSPYSGEVSPAAPDSTSPDVPSSEPSQGIDLQA